MGLCHGLIGGGPPEAPGWVSGEAREPLSATHVRIHLLAEGGRIVAVRPEVRGCPHTMAAVALVAERLTGCPVEGLDVDPRAIAVELGAPATKLGRFFAVQDAVRNAALLLREGPA
jgi:NifU-like protein involved in Fe-S cluster formation